MQDTFLINIAILLKFLKDLNPLNARYMFYMVTPNETIYSNFEDIPNYYLNPGTTWMFALIFVEFLLLDEEKYALNDTITSINCGMLHLLPKIGGHYISVFVYPLVYERLHIVDLPKDSAFTWILCFFTHDLIYYLLHRAVHEAGVLWSFHQVHHSSEYFNLSTSLRVPAIQDTVQVFFDILQATFIPPNIFIVHRYLNLIFQFWIHSSVIPHLGPLEYFLNTPSSHRVHHGRNPYCIDRNYGGVLIIWDRLFGTYEPERKDDKVIYGLTTPVETFNQLWCQFFLFKALGYEKGQMRNEKNEEVFPGVWGKVKAALWPPAYLPGMETKFFFFWLCMKDNTEGSPEIKYPHVRYCPPLTVPLRLYLIAEWILLVTCFLKFDQIRVFLSWPEFLCRFGFIISYIQMFGYYFDHSRYSLIFDSIRLLLSILLGIVLNDSQMTAYGLASSAAILLLSSAGQICLSCDRLKKKCYV